MLDALIYSESLMLYTVLFFRAALIPIILFNLSYSWRGPVGILRGKPDSTSIYRSVVFFGSLALLGFQITGLSRTENVGEGPLSLTFILLFMLMQMSAAIGRLMNSYGKFDKIFTAVENGHLDVVLRVLQVAEVNSELMDKHVLAAEKEALKDLIA